VAIAVGFGILASNAAAEEKVDFTKQILPIFKESCEKCHGEKRASGKMRLHTAAGLKEKWDADKGLITAGKPDESELYKRLVLPKGADPDRANRVLEKGKTACLVTSSLSVPVRLEAEILAAV